MAGSAEQFAKCTRLKAFFTAVSTVGSSFSVDYAKLFANLVFDRFSDLDGTGFWSGRGNVYLGCCGSSFLN